MNRRVVAHPNRRLLISLALLAQLAALAPSAAEAQRYHGPRLRLGASGVGGGFVGSVHGGLGGLSIRAGVQFDDVFGLLIQGQGLVGLFAPYPDERIAGFAFHQVMLELTAASIFQVAIGPSLDFVWGCSAASGQAVCSRGGVYFGADLRLALLLGGRHASGSRSAFALSIDFHPTLLDDDSWSMVGLLGLGVELY